MKCFNLILLYFFIIPVFQTEFVDFEKEEIEIKKITQNEVEVIIPFQILDGYHIQSNREVPENILPTEVDLKNNPLYEIKKIEFISVKYQDILLGDQNHEVISGEFKLKLSLKLMESLTDNNKGIFVNGILSYQACDDIKCFYPRDLEFKARIDRPE